MDGGRGRKSREHKSNSQDKGADKITRQQISLFNQTNPTILYQSTTILTSTLTMPSPRQSYASSTYSYSTTADSIKDAKQAAQESSSKKAPSPKKDSILQKAKKVLTGPSAEEEAARKAARTPEQAMMEKYGATRGNMMMGPH